MLEGLRLTGGATPLDALPPLPAPLRHRGLHSLSCACAVLGTSAANHRYPHNANHYEQAAPMLLPCLELYMHRTPLMGFFMHNAHSSTLMSHA